MSKKIASQNLVMKFMLEIWRLKTSPKDDVMVLLHCDNMSLTIIFNNDNFHDISENIFWAHIYDTKFKLPLQRKLKLLWLFGLNLMDIFVDKVSMKNW